MRSGSPASSAAAWRSISNAIARSTERNEFMFLTSTRVPNASVPRGPERDVRLDAKLAALHVRIGRADRAQQELELLGVAPRLLGGADVGLGDDLHERHAGAVEVDEAEPLARRALAVHELGRVLLEVRAGDAGR